MVTTAVGSGKRQTGHCATITLTGAADTFIFGRKKRKVFNLMELDLNIPYFLLMMIHTAREPIAIAALISALLCLLTGSRRFEHGAFWWPFYWFGWALWLIGITGLAAPILSPAVSLPFIIPGNSALIMQIILGIAGGLLVSTLLMHRPVRSSLPVRYVDSQKRI